MVLATNYGKFDYASWTLDKPLFVNGTLNTPKYEKRSIMNPGSAVQAAYWIHETSDRIHLEAQISLLWVAEPAIHGLHCTKSIKN